MPRLGGKEKNDIVKVDRTAWLECSIHFPMFDAYDTLAEVVLYCDALSVLNLACTCRKLCVVLCDDDLWAELTLRDYGEDRGTRAIYKEKWRNKAQSYFSAIKRLQSATSLAALMRMSVGVDENDASLAPLARRVRTLRMITEQRITIQNKVKGIAVSTVILGSMYAVGLGNLPPFSIPHGADMTAMLKTHLLLPAVVSAIAGWYRGATQSDNAPRTMQFYFDTAQMQELSIFQAVLYSIHGSLQTYGVIPLLYLQVFSPGVNFLHKIDLYPLYVLLIGLVFFPYHAITLVPWTQAKFLTAAITSGFSALSLLVMFLSATLRGNLVIIARLIIAFAALTIFSPKNRVGACLPYLLTQYIGGKAAEYSTMALMYPFHLVNNFIIRGAPITEPGIVGATATTFLQSKGRKRLLFVHYMFNAYGASCCATYGLGVAMAQRVICHLAFLLPQMLLSWGGIKPHITVRRGKME
jgi:hypothetical protein